MEDTGQELRILTKWIIIEKVDEGDIYKVKARLVVLGNMEEGFLLFKLNLLLVGRIQSGYY